MRKRKESQTGNSMEKRDTPIDKNKQSECLFIRMGRGLWQLVQLIIDTPLDIPSVLFRLDPDNNEAEILNLINERSEKYRSLVNIGIAYTTLCILSLVALFILVIVGYVFNNPDKIDNWLVPSLAFSAIPLVVSPIYWYKKYCLKEYIRNLDNCIRLIELYHSTEINSEYKSAIIGEYFLRKHSKNTKIIIDLSPNKRRITRELL